MRVKRIATGWMAQCVEVPGAISEMQSLEEVEDHQREAIAFVEDISPSQIGTLTINGEPVTEEMIAAWAEEAERGYDVEMLRARRRCR
ncbi:hypothetical protein SAMN05421595_1370 [Austwickia chelonae]|nr:hypothetical protein SAMN05421595_1370 [Austwickia chelonae]